MEFQNWMRNGEVVALGWTLLAAGIAFIFLYTDKPIGMPMNGDFERAITMLALVTVVGVLVIGVLVYFLVLSSGQGHKKAKTPKGPDHSPTFSTAPPGQHINNTQIATPLPVPNSAEIVGDARSFTDAWLNSSLSQSAWLDGMRRYCTSDFMSQLANTQPTDIPSVRRTGDPTVSLSGQGYATVNVPLDNGTLILSFGDHRGKWLIGSYDFKRTP